MFTGLMQGTPHCICWTSLLVAGMLVLYPKGTEMAPEFEPNCRVRMRVHIYKSPLVENVGKWSESDPDNVKQRNLFASILETEAKSTFWTQAELTSATIRSTRTLQSAIDIRWRNLK